jgi:demethylmacrocin O-methyltransferase
MLTKLEESMKKRLSAMQLLALKRYMSDFRAFGYGGSMKKLAEIYGTDKWGGHRYAQHYQMHFKKFKYKRIVLLEIGIGGYENPYYGGASLRMWRKYFPFATICGIDIFDKKPQEERRIKTFRGSQIDEVFLNSVEKSVGRFDLIIDDGSHFNSDVIESFKILFPKLNDGGLYVIEDTQTSYWPVCGGNSNDMNNGKTSMSFFKNLIDGLNHQEFLIKGYKETYYDQKIISMHFYHNMVFIYKGNNDEKSNVVKKHELPALEK